MGLSWWYCTMRIFRQINCCRMHQALAIVWFHNIQNINYSSLNWCKTVNWVNSFIIHNKQLRKNTDKLFPVDWRISLSLAPEVCISKTAAELKVRMHFEVFTSFNIKHDLLCETTKYLLNQKVHTIYRALPLEKCWNS